MFKVKTMIKKDISKIIEKDHVKFISVCFVDALGQLRSKLVNKRKVIDALNKDGKGLTIALPSLALGYCDTQVEISGFSSNKDKFGDIPAKIDFDSLRILPFENEGQNLICFIELEDEYKSFCSRSILKKILNKANKQDLYPRFGVELEFTLLDETSKSIKNKSYNNLSTTTLESSYNLLQRQNLQSEIYNDFINFSEIMKIEVEAWHEEMGAGFMEVALLSGKTIKSADDTILVKHLIKQIAIRHDKVATFMARWSNDADGHSGHIHISLENGKKENLFKNNSKTFKNFVSGMQSYSPELMLLFAPNANSFKRYQPEIFTPIMNDWDWDSRKVAFRAIKGEKSRIENRIPGADMNPYLGIAATIATGLEGINNNDSEKVQRLVKLPSNVSEACKKLERSKIAKKYFSNEFVSFFCEFRQKENAIESSKITDIEKKRLIEFS